MTDMTRPDPAGSVAISEDPKAWGPQDAPLEMPCQRLEADVSLFDLSALIRLLMPGQRA